MGGSGKGDKDGKESRKRGDEEETRKGTRDEKKRRRGERDWKEIRFTGKERISFKRCKHQHPEKFASLPNARYEPSSFDNCPSQMRLIHLKELYIPLLSNSHG